MRVYLDSCLIYRACKSHLFCAVLYCRLWPVWLKHVFPHYLINGTIFIKKFFERVCFDFLYNLCLKHFSFQEVFREILSHMYVSLHVKTCYSCEILMKLECFLQILEKFLNIKFHENPSWESRVVSCGQTDMRNLLVAFHKFANAFKNQSYISPAFLFVVDESRFGHKKMCL
jgi:hypothetical protein